MTTAQLSSLVVQIAHAFSGSKSKAPPVSPVSFLPFPEWQPLGTVEKAGPDKTTQMVLTELGGKRRLPIHVLAALMSCVEKGA